MTKESETLTQMKELLPGVLMLPYHTYGICDSKSCCPEELCDDCIEVGDYAKQEMRIKFQEVVVNVTVSEIKKLFKFMKTDFMEESEMQYNCSAGDCFFYIDCDYDSFFFYRQYFVEYILRIGECLNSKQLAEFFKQFLTFNDVNVNKDIFSYIEKNKEKLHCKNLQNLIATHIVLDA